MIRPEQSSGWVVPLALAVFAGATFTGAYLGGDWSFWLPIAGGCVLALIGCVAWLRHR